MPTLDEARATLALANRILAREGVLGAFGHVSVRHPSDPGRYLLAHSRSLELVEPVGILEFTLDSQPVNPPTGMLLGERVIHGCICHERPDVLAGHLSPSFPPLAWRTTRPKPPGWGVEILEAHRRDRW